MHFTNLFTVLNDALRWLVTLILLPFTFWVIFWSLNIPFEFIIRHTERFYTIFYILMWVIISGAFITFCMMIGKIISFILLFLVRQKLNFYFLFLVCSLVFVCYVYYIVWSDSIMLSWEFFNRPTLNRAIFTLFITIYVFSIYFNISSIISNIEINKFNKEQ